MVSGMLSSYSRKRKERVARLYLAALHGHGTIACIKSDCPIVAPVIDVHILLHVIIPVRNLFLLVFRHTTSTISV